MAAMLTNRLLKKSIFPGCSKMPRCKAPEILRSEAYLSVRRNDEGWGQRRRWAFFSSPLVWVRTTLLLSDGAGGPCKGLWIPQAFEITFTGR